MDDVEREGARTAPAPKRVRGTGTRKKPAKRRIVRFSGRRAKLFLETLGTACNVAAACRASGLSESTVYRRRRGDPDFLAGWHAALREGVERLEVEMLDRALNGVEKAVWHGGKQVGSIRHYNDGLALALLRAHGPSVGRPAPAATPASQDQQAAELIEWLGEMNLRLGGAG